MRVITGSARGRRLYSPEGYDVRPTTDKIKESIFNIIQFDISGAYVLDLFAGSGQMGIEALSRGAEKAVFVDSSRKSLETVKMNIDLCRFSESAAVVFSDAFSYLMTCTDKFNIVFLDPPYNKNMCLRALPMLERVLCDNALVICETECDENFDEIQGKFDVVRVYNYSSIKLTVFRKTE